MGGIFTLAGMLRPDKIVLMCEGKIGSSGCRIVAWISNDTKRDWGSVEKYARFYAFVSQSLLQKDIRPYLINGQSSAGNKAFSSLYCTTLCPLTWSAEPFLFNNLYDFFRDRRIMAVLMIRSVATVAEYNHVVTRARSTTAYFAQRRFYPSLGRFSTFDTMVGFRNDGHKCYWLIDIAARLGSRRKWRV
jgi:hypothetical protein